MTGHSSLGGGNRAGRTLQGRSGAHRTGRAQRAQLGLPCGGRAKVGCRAGPARQTTDAMVNGVSRGQDASGAHSDANRAIEKSSSAKPIQKRGSASRDSGNFTKGVDLSHPLVHSVCHKEIAIGGKGKVGWGPKRGKGASAIRPLASPTARKGEHCAIGEDTSYAIVLAVSHVYIPTAIQRYPRRVLKCCSAPAIGKWRGAPCASQRDHRAQGGDFADKVVTIVCHIDHPCRINCEALRKAETRMRPLPICPGGSATSCKCACHPSEQEQSNAVVASIRNVENSRGGVRCHATGLKKTCCSSSAISPRGRTITSQGTYKARG